MVCVCVLKLIGKQSSIYLSVLCSSGPLYYCDLECSLCSIYIKVVSDSKSLEDFKVSNHNLKFSLNTVNVFCTSQNYWLQSVLQGHIMNDLSDRTNPLTEHLPEPNKVLHFHGIHQFFCNYSFHVFILFYWVS